MAVWQNPESPKRYRTPCGTASQEVSKGDGGRRERPARPPRDHQLEVDIEVLKTGKVRCLEYGMKFLGKVLCVHLSRPEGDEGAHVPKDGVLYLRIQLVEVLIGKRKRYSKLPEFAEDARDTGRGVVLELIQKYMEGNTLCFLGIDP